MGLVWPVADRPVVGRFLSPLGYYCWVGECLEERQRVQLPTETLTSAWTTTPGGSRSGKALLGGLPAK